MIMCLQSYTVQDSNSRYTLKFQKVPRVTKRCTEKVPERKKKCTEKVPKSKKKCTEKVPKSKKKKLSPTGLEPTTSTRKAAV